MTPTTRSADHAVVGRTRQRLFLLAGAAMATGAVMLFGAIGNPASATAAVTSVTLCHATNSTHHPYNSVTVSGKAILTQILGPHGHSSHTGPVFDPLGGKKQADWGDIIPPFVYDSGGTNINYPGLNWSDGQAIWDNGCKMPDAPASSTPPVSSSVPTSSAPDPTSSSPTSDISGSDTSSAPNPPAPNASTTTVVVAVAPTTAADGPIPQGVAAGLHTKVLANPMTTWGLLVLAFGAFIALFAGVQPRLKRRVH